MFSYGTRKKISEIFQVSNDSISKHVSYIFYVQKKFCHFQVKPLELGESEEDSISVNQYRTRRIEDVANKSTDISKENIKLRYDGSIWLPAISVAVCLVGAVIKKYLI